MKVPPVFFLPALACLTAHTAEETPAWAMKAFNEKLSIRYELVQKPEPSFYVGDFNGDGTSDIALLIKEKATGTHQSLAEDFKTIDGRGRAGTRLCNVTALL